MIEKSEEWVGYLETSVKCSHITYGSLNILEFTKWPASLKPTENTTASSIALLHKEGTILRGLEMCSAIQNHVVGILQRRVYKAHIRS